MKEFEVAACVLFLAVMLAGCTIDNSTNPPNMTVSKPCDSSTGTVTPGFQSTWLTWQGVAVMAAATVFTLSILAYTLGYALSHKKAIMWAKEQMEEALLAIVIVIFVIGFVSFLCTLNLAALGLDPGCGGTTYNLFDAAQCELTNLYAVIGHTYVLVAGINGIATAAGSMSLGMAPGGVGVVVSPFAVFGDVSQGFVLALIVLLTSAILTISQILLLSISQYLFTILFPVGLVLRSFGATRGFGGGLMAIALGFFLFYPLLVVLFYGSVNGDASNDYATLNMSFQKSGLSPSNANWFGGFLSPLVQIVGQIMLGAIFMPLIMFMILVAFVKGLSRALGEEVDVSNLTRLI